jgi:hypothetical protein
VVMLQRWEVQPSQSHQCSQAGPGRDSGVFALLCVCVCVSVCVCLWFSVFYFVAVLGFELSLVFARQVLNHFSPEE